MAVAAQKSGDAAFYINRPFVLLRFIELLRELMDRVIRAGASSC